MNKTGPTRNQRRKKVWARSATTRRLLDPLWLQDSLALNRGISPFMGGIAGLQAALSLLAAIVLVRHSLWPELVGFPALGALAALFGRHAPLVKRHGIVWMCAAQLTGAVFVTSLASYIGLSPAMVVLVVALVATTSTIIFSYWNLGVPGAVIIVFAAGAAMTPVDSWTMVVERTVATAGGGLVAWLITSATDFLRLPELARIKAAPVTKRPLKHILIAGGRIGIGAAVAALIAYAAGWSHPSWAAIGATAVMQGGHLHITMYRALQRMAGTLFGALLVWLILALDPPFWAIVAAIAIFQYITEIIIGYNYALGQITVTPMALLMTYLAMPGGSPADMAIERVFDTMLGAILGIVFAVIFSTIDDRRHLARYHRNRKSERRSGR
ncbi:MAG TPA: FUSC family protein [Burkholderiaceae bacterium]|nr:FUSC family protein [Burkholderiaceae bacterium]